MADAPSCQAQGASHTGTECREGAAPRLAKTKAEGALNALGPEQRGWRVGLPEAPKTFRTESEKAGAKSAGGGYARQRRWYGPAGARKGVLTGGAETQSD